MPPEYPLPPKFGRFLEHWKSLRTGAAVPNLSDFLDRPITEFQSWVHIADIESKTHHPVRLTGTALVNFFGYDITGLNFLDVMTPNVRPILQSAHQAVVEQPCGMFYRGVATTSSGRQTETDVIILPINRTNGGKCVLRLLDPGTTLHFTETSAKIMEMMERRWIDLGSGVPG